MSEIEKILQAKIKGCIGKKHSLSDTIKPKEKQIKLVEAVVSEKISAKEFIAFFEFASDVDKGTCADAMKYVSAEKPEILAPFVNTLIKYINYKAPRVKWGVPEAIGNMSKDYPEQTAKAIPYLLKNTTDDKINTTVIKWCAAFALGEIAKNNQKAAKTLVLKMKELAKKETNNGVKNVYLKALKVLGKKKN